MSIDWGRIESAVKNAVVTASGLNADLVRWAYQSYQGVARPAGKAFIAMQFGPSIPVGLDGYADATDLTRANGQEIELYTLATREIVLTLQAYGGTPAGATSALALLMRVRERFALPAVRGYLNAVGVSPFGVGAVRYVPAIEGTKFEGRAICEIRCYVDASESEFVGYIDSVDVTGVYAGPVGTFCGTFTVAIGD